MEQPPNPLNEAADKLVQLGYATRILLDPHHCVFDLTPAGVTLFESLHQIFGVPGRHPSTVPKAEILSLVGLILFQAIPPSGNGQRS